MLDKVKESISQGRQNHAYLLTGNSASTSTAALSLAQAILCESNTSCGSCRSCKQVAGGNHPDLQIIENEAKAISIDQTRKFQHFANYMTYQGGKSVVIIKDAQNMLDAAANSILKIIEEPPAGVHFILTAPNGDALLTTIISRCTWLRLGSEVEEEKKDFQVNIDSDVAKILNVLATSDAECLKFSAELKKKISRDVGTKNYLRYLLQQLILKLNENMRENKGQESLDLYINGTLKLEKTLRAVEANVNTALLLDELMLNLRQIYLKAGK